MRRILSVAAGLFVLACSSPIEAGPLPTLRGMITAYSGGRYTVNDLTGTQCAAWKVGITPGTQIVDANGVSLPSAALRVGQRVQVFSDVVATSCPAQTTATKIVAVN